MSPSSVVHPPLGTLIDEDCLELVEVLGVGGYGVVYRAVDVSSPIRKSYAVKCLAHSEAHQTHRQRQIHIREITLHQLASQHPGVVTLHRVIEDLNHTYIIMDYAPDHDLFTQILHSCRYLGDDALIKHVFLQLLDAVEHCHSLGIYHRDLKPENVLCFDDGLRIAITDFGLATTDKVSDEFRTGSVYHMSPECQGGEFAPMGHYSPMFNDIWSLGIILLNLTTGRNPWKSATEDDLTFQAYLQDPLNFLPTVLPISPELNDILTRMLEVDWRDRMTLPELRQAIEEVDVFYSDGVVFEGSMARCDWEAGMDVDSDSSTKEETPPPRSPCDEEYSRSRWSKDSDSDIVFAPRSVAEESSYGLLWTDYSSCGATWAFESSSSLSDYGDDQEAMDIFGPERPETPDSPISSGFSLPTTPDWNDMSFANRVSKPPAPRKGLTIDTNIPVPRVYDASIASMASFSTNSSMMHTAIEFDPYSSSFIIAGAAPLHANATSFAMTESSPNDREMESPSMWAFSPSETLSGSSPLRYPSDGSSMDSGGDIGFTRSATPSPDSTLWSSSMGVGITLQNSPRINSSQLSTPVHDMMTNVFIPPSRPSIFSARKKSKSFHDSHRASGGTKNKEPSLTGGIFKFLPRSLSPSPPPFSPPPTASSTASSKVPLSSPSPSPKVRATGRYWPSQYSTSDPTDEQGAEEVRAPPTAPITIPIPYNTSAEQGFSGCRRRNKRAPHIRSPRYWFAPGRLFASTGES